MGPQAKGLVGNYGALVFFVGGKKHMHLSYLGMQRSQARQLATNQALYSEPSETMTFLAYWACSSCSCKIMACSRLV